MSTAGYNQYTKLLQESDIEHDKNMVCKEATRIMEEECEEGTYTNFPKPWKWTNKPTKFRDSKIEEEKTTYERATEDLLKLHLNYNHMPFKKIQTMAKQGILPKKYLNCRIPLCTAWMYSKAIKRRTPNRNNNKNEARKPTQLGECISVDQLVSPTGGLIAQMTGFFTKRRYNYATVYVDQYSNRGYV